MSARGRRWGAQGLEGLSPPCHAPLLAMDALLPRAIWRQMYGLRSLQILFRVSALRVPHAHPDWEIHMHSPPVFLT